MGTRVQDANNWTKGQNPQSDEFARFNTAQAGAMNTLDSQQKEAMDAARANTGYAMQVADELRGLARTQINDVMASTATANANFEGDRTATLSALKDDVAQNMNSFRGANDNFIAVGLQKAQEALIANGSADDPLARLQAEAQVKGQYAEQLGRQMTQLQSNYSQRLADTHLSLTAERTKLFATTEAAKNQAFSTAGTNVANAGATVSRARELEVGALQEMSAFRADFADKQAVHSVEAFKALGQDAREAAQMANMVDQWAAQMDAQNTAQTAANLFGAEQLVFGGYASLAGHVINTTWSVPQMNMSDTLRTV